MPALFLTYTQSPTAQLVTNKESAEIQVCMWVARPKRGQLLDRYIEHPVRVGLTSPGWSHRLS
jgi:hypothetical protein